MRATFLSQLQDCVFYRLGSMPYFVDIELLRRQQTYVGDVLSNALAGISQKDGKAGACVIVGIPEVVTDAEQGQGGGLLKVRVPVEVVENELFNRGEMGTGKFVDEIAATVYAALKGVQWGSLDMTGPLFADASPIMPVKGEAGDANLHTMVRLGCLWGLTFDARCAFPVISEVAAGTFALGCATPGATVWYTMDGSYPFAGNPQAQAFEEPVTISVTTTVRAIAYADGLDPSNELATRVVLAVGGSRTTGDGDNRITGDGDNRITGD